MSDEKKTDALVEEQKEDKKKDDKKSKDVKVEKKEKAEKKETKKEKTKMTDLKPGMTVRVYQKIKELNIKGEEKQRVQYFDGMVIARKHGKESGATVTIRKVSNGVGVEKIFPINLPTIEKVEIKKKAEVKRAKLYFLKRGYRKKLKETKVS